MKPKYLIMFGSLALLIGVVALMFRENPIHSSSFSVSQAPEEQKTEEIQDAEQIPIEEIAGEAGVETENNDAKIKEEPGIAPVADDSKKVAAANDAASSVPQEPVKKEAEQKKTKSSLSSSLTIKNKLVDFGYAVPSKPRAIDTIILHSSYNSLGGDPYSIDSIIDIYEGYGVAAHYLIGRDGVVYRLVKDENIAYHAGVSEVPDGRKNVNDFSIGIEIVNTKDGEYADEQYAAVKSLIKSLKGDYDIKYTLGHDDIAPGRKTDPWNFDWGNL